MISRLLEILCPPLRRARAELLAIRRENIALKAELGRA
jgi:hypothetical protein